MINDNSLTGKKPPDEIIVRAKFRESNVLIEKIFKITKIDTVNAEYNKRIFIDCFIISEELKDKKLVKDFFKLSS